MITPHQVMEAFAKNDLPMMMDAVRIVAARAPQPLVITNPANYVAHIIHELGQKDQEEFWVTTLNNAHEIIETHRLYTGTAYAAIMRLSEIARIVILDNATTFIVAHNHPGGQHGIAPSPEDLSTTKRLNQLAMLIGIPLMDHVIVAPGQWYSFSEHGLLKENNNVRKNEVPRPPRLPRAGDQRPK